MLGVAQAVARIATNCHERRGRAIVPKKPQPNQLGPAALCAV